MYDRRDTDKPGFTERVATLETDVKHITTSMDTMQSTLREHIEVENANDVRIWSAMERIATTTESHGTLLSKMSDVLDGIASTNTRTSLLEAHREHTEVRLGNLEQKTEETEDQVKELKLERNFILKALSLLGVALSAGWAVFTHFWK